MPAVLELTPGQLPGYLAKIEEACDNIPLDGFFDRALMAMRTASLNCFHNSCDPWGNPWAPVKFRPRDAGGTKQPLRDTDILMASLTGDAEGTLVQKGDNFLRYGTALEYAAVHQWGGTIYAKSADFLCIPATMDAARAGSPRNFPRKLRPIINATRTGGVMVEDRIKGKKIFGPLENPDAPKEPKKKVLPPITKMGKIKMPKPKPKPLKLFGPLSKKEQKIADRKAKDEVVQYYMTVAVNIPARPFLGWSDTLADKITLILDDWLLGQEGHITLPFFKSAA